MSEIIVIVIIITLLLIVFVYIFNKEGFGNKDERAEKIVENTKNIMSKPSYGKFKTAMGGDTDVVEYDAAKKAYKDGDYNIEKLKNHL